MFMIDNRLWGSLSVKFPSEKKLSWELSSLFFRSVKFSLCEKEKKLFCSLSHESSIKIETSKFKLKKNIILNLNDGIRDAFLMFSFLKMIKLQLHRLLNSSLHLFNELRESGSFMKRVGKNKKEEKKSNQNIKKYIFLLNFLMLN